MDKQTLDKIEALQKKLSGMSKEEREKLLNHALSISSASDPAELRRLADEAEERVRMEKLPQVRTNPNFDTVIAMCEDMISNVGNGTHSDDDDSEFQHFLYEEILTSLYGDKVWGFINGR